MNIRVQENESSDEAVARVLAKAPRRVFVLGATDVGKSSFCQALVAAASERGGAAALVDSDLGQKTAGPPAAVTCSETGRPDRLSQLAFVGTTDPVAGFADLIRGTGDLVRRCEADLVVINTSGLVAGAGRRLKAEKIRAVCPDLIVAIGDDPALCAILSDHAGLRCVRLERRPGARRKTKGERRAARREAFRSYFAQARLWNMTALNQGDVELVDGQLLGLRGVDGRDLAIGIAVCTDPGARPQVLAPGSGVAAAKIIPGTVVMDASFQDVPLAASVASRDRAP